MAATYYSDMVNRRTCVYRCYDEDEVLLYIGLSMNLDGRLSKHRSAGWWPEVVEVTVAWYEGREAAKAAEKRAIATENPVHNITRPVSVTVREVAP